MSANDHVATQTARVVMMAGARRVEIADKPLRAPEPGEIQVRTLYSAISHGTEMNVYRGVAPQWDRVQDPATRPFLQQPGQATWHYPQPYGYANVGEVSRLGDGVTDFEIGDRVFCYVPHQTGYNVPAKAAVRLPSDLNPILGALFANLNTATNGILDARIVLGDNVVVFGQGVIGLLITQLACRSGAGSVIAVDRFARRLALAGEFGANVTLNIDETQDVALAVRGLTEGRGADVVIDVTGAYGPSTRQCGQPRLNTWVIAMSWYHGTAASLDLSGEFHHNRITIRCSQVGSINPELGPHWSVERRMQMVLKLLTELKLQPLITHRVPFEQAAHAYQLVDEHPADVVQVILTY